MKEDTGNTVKRLDKYKISVKGDRFLSHRFSRIWRIQISQQFKQKSFMFISFKCSGWYVETSTKSLYFPYWLGLQWYQESELVLSCLLTIPTLIDYTLGSKWLAITSTFQELEGIKWKKKKSSFIRRWSLGIALSIFIYFPWT